MLIATSPRLSSDQEEKKTTDEAYPVEADCMSAKGNSGIFCGKRGDTQTHEEHSRHIPISQSTYERMADWITTKLPKELSDNQQTINARSPVYYSSVKPTIKQSDIQHHTKQATESQGELMYDIQHAEGPPEELDSSQQTAVQTDEFCNVLQTAAVESVESTLAALTVQSEGLHGSMHMPTVPSELCTTLQTSTVQSEHPTNHLQISTLKSDKFCIPLRTATLQSEEPFTSSHTATVQSEEPFKALHTATVQSEEPFTASHTATVQSEESFTSLYTAAVQPEEPCSSIQMPVVPPELPLDCLQSATVNSEGPCNSSWTATDKPQELNRPLQTSTDQSEKLTDLPNTASLQPLDLFYSEETVQIGEHCSLGQSALHDLYHPGEAVPNHSEVPDQSAQVTTVQAECHHAMKAKEGQVDSIVNSGQRSSTQFTEPYYVKQPSPVQSEEIYLSRTCDSHWSDSVTANKVAVEGDLNG